MTDSDRSSEIVAALMYLNLILGVSFTCLLAVLAVELPGVISLAAIVIAPMAFSTFLAWIFVDQYRDEEGIVEGTGA